MIWFIVIPIDLMIFLFQRLQKQNLRSLPLIGGNELILSFLYSPGVGFHMWKSGSKNVGVRIRSLSNLCTGYGQISLQAALQMGGENKVDKILTL